MGVCERLLSNFLKAFVANGWIIISDSSALEAKDGEGFLKPLTSELERKEEFSLLHGLHFIRLLGTVLSQAL